MKITDVECLILDQQFPLVRVCTDEGLVGIGECFRRQPQLVKSVIDNMLNGEWPVSKYPWQVNGGYLDVPDGPGPGIERDDDVVNRLAQQ